MKSFESIVDFGIKKQRLRKKFFKNMRNKLFSKKGLRDFLFIASIDSIPEEVIDFLIRTNVKNIEEARTNIQIWIDFECAFLGINTIKYHEFGSKKMFINLLIKRNKYLIEKKFI